MILTTLVAAVTYGWIEGFVITGTRTEATQVWWVLGHFSTYSISMGVMFACITGGFGLIKGRNMFKHGKRYFLLTFLGNYPFSWMIQDFAFFWFYPDFRLTDERWTNWILGGVWVLDPWRSGVRIWIPTWYLMFSVFWVGMMWWAHRCTVYDNLAKEEIASEIVPTHLQFPHLFPKKSSPVSSPSQVPLPSFPSKVRPVAPGPVWRPPQPRPMRSVAGAEAIKRIRERRSK